MLLFGTTDDSLSWLAATLFQKLVLDLSQGRNGSFIVANPIVTVITKIHANLCLEDCHFAAMIAHPSPELFVWVIKW